MQLTLGIKTDPIQYRYSYDWLFDLCVEAGIKFVQLGSFFELYLVGDDYVLGIKEKAEKRGLKIKSCFTAHRELGGFFTGEAALEKVARKAYERYIEVAALLGAEFVGSNPGAVYRDCMSAKQQGIECYLGHMRELMHIAADKGLRGLTIEPMSCLAEPPSTPEEILYMMTTLENYHQANCESTVPVFLCGDISHGVADQDRNVIYDNISLFEMQIPYMAEFHFKNTDKIFNSTFGFSPEECERGIVNLPEFRQLLDSNQKRWPILDVTGYLEIGGPKLGRDYSDPLLGKMLKDSLKSLRQNWQENH